MIIRSLEETSGTAHDVRGETWRSQRLLLSADGMGFSLHETTMAAGTATRMHYKHHVEAVYCIAGRGEIEDLETGDVHAIVPGVVYALDAHERHELRVEEEMRLVCVFNPPIRGDETHGPDGAYPSAAMLDGEAAE